MRIVGLDHLAGRQQVLGAQHLRGLAPGHRLAGDQQGLGKHALAPCRCRAAPRPPCGLPSCQRRDEVEQIGGVLASMAVKGSSSRISARILQQQAGEQVRCICPPDRVAIGRRSKPVRPTAASASSMRVRSRRPMPPNRPDRDHRPMDDEIVDGERKGPVDLGRLRQIGDRCGRRQPEADVRLEGLATRRRCP